MKSEPRNEIEYKQAIVVQSCRRLIYHHCCIGVEGNFKMQLHTVIIGSMIPTASQVGFRILIVFEGEKMIWYETFLLKGLKLFIHQ